MMIEVGDRTVHHSSEAEYITVCRKPVKQSLAGAINRIGPCKHDSLSAKRCLAPLCFETLREIVIGTSSLY